MVEKKYLLTYTDKYRIMVGLTRYDIGGEVISILTRGMYPDPRDALREYIQNGVDAKAENIRVNIRQDSITIDDNGYGMDKETIRNAIRVGISEKNPNKNVGFMGIGIYSSFHLCNKLTIYSKSSKESPHVLSFDFKSMRDILEKQRHKRLKKELKSEDLIDLQSLLEKFITLKELRVADFPDVGTRVEILGLDPVFFEQLSNFDAVADYLREVVPLHFDKENFKWGELIEEKISKISTEHKAHFELINLELQVNNKKENLFRPYKDNEFHNDDSLKPYFEVMKKGDIFFGVAWGCLNSIRRKIDNDDLRGFLLKKQGFAIGKREYLTKYFTRSTYFDRYIGEIVILNKELLPNAARSDLQFSNLRNIFFGVLTDVASKFNDFAHIYQEYTKGDDEIQSATHELKEININFPQYSENADELLNNIVEIRRIRDNIKGRLDRDSVRPERIKDADNIIKVCDKIEKSIRYRLEYISKIKKKDYSKEEKDKPLKISKELRDISVKDEKEKEYSNLIDVLEQSDFQLSNDLKKTLEIIDDKFIHGNSTNELDYKKMLSELKKEIDELNLD